MKYRNLCPSLFAISLIFTSFAQTKTVEVKKISNCFSHTDARSRGELEAQVSGCAFDHVGASATAGCAQGIDTGSTEPMVVQSYKITGKTKCEDAIYSNPNPDMGDSVVGISCET